MPGDRTLRSLDASHAIPMRVLRFEVSGLRRRTPVRPVLLTGQTSTHRSDRSDQYPPVIPVRPTGQTGLALLQHRIRFFGLGLILCGSTKEPSGILVNHVKPRELGVASANLYS
jgi:hypothetical protein